MTDDQIEALVNLIKNHTAAGRLTNGEVAEVIKFLEARSFLVQPSA